ncbi:hypothetical protein AM493_10280 [Flavobacterium akiainvivens]|uniref:YhcH/YjgK/YiaL family protein n=1 Tax=Flavobacterium akiainvivens TaxID=1202724 RepID=A0A0N0RQQ8_9FLAO|nr:YhcH/YjgK/YiaL family protein [Flavobacterium akiainvivens]KOS06372.1 hypothetical protein AM493_10280 [Flavobacterium akiainvivens]SFQ14941.1 YhcH/YjgK/YiaL family protein [Flavobacterium akiainvivens]
MIIDKIENWPLYFKKPLFAELFKELENYSKDTTNGVYKDHDNYYFKVMSYDTKENSTVIESHRKEVDIQIVYSGAEHIKIYDAASVEIIEAYDAETDCQFYKPVAPAFTEVTLRPGFMAIFFPNDIHHPQFAVNKPETIKKIVVKVDEKLFS